MKKKLIMIGLALAMLFSIEYARQVQAHTTVSFNLFFDALAPYGNWVSTPDYGYVWSPTDVGPDWEPYTNGYWVWTDYGWTWVSYEPWGWAPFHYGRWVYTDYYGWVWIPGTVWAPAWVTWYESPDYIGWAPLPPDERFSLEVGISFSNRNYYVPYRDVVFVPSHAFLSTHIRNVIVPRSRNITIIRNTKVINNITIQNNRVINRGPDVNFVERATRARIQKVNLVDRDVDQRTVIRGGKINQIKGKDFYVYRPDVIRKGNEAPVIKKNVEKNTIQNRNRNVEIENKNRKNVEIRNEGYLTPNQGHTVFNRDAENNPMKIKNKNKEVYNPNEKKIKKQERIENRNNPQNPKPHQQYPMRRDDNNRKGNPFVMQDTFKSHSPVIRPENRQPVYRNTEKEAPHYQFNSDIKGQKFQKKDFGQHPNNRNLDSRRNHKQIDRNG